MPLLRSWLLTRRLVFGLTATPIYNYGGEMFDVLECVRPGAFGEWSEFSNEWCGGDITAVKEPKALGAYLRAEGIMLRRVREDVGRELPPFERTFHLIDCDSEPLEEIESSARDLALTIMAEGPERERSIRARRLREARRA